MHDCFLSILGGGGFIVLLLLIFPQTDEAFTDFLINLHDYIEHHCNK